eukprot:EG_transcript_397
MGDSFLTMTLGPVDAAFRNLISVWCQERFREARLYGELEEAFQRRRVELDANVFFTATMQGRDLITGHMLRAEALVREATVKMIQQLELAETVARGRIVLDHDVAHHELERALHRAQVDFEMAELHRRQTRLLEQSAVVMMQSAALKKQREDLEVSKAAFRAFQEEAAAAAAAAKTPGLLPTVPRPDRTFGGRLPTAQERVGDLQDSLSSKGRPPVEQSSDWGALGPLDRGAEGPGGHRSSSKGPVPGQDTRRRGSGEEDAAVRRSSPGALQELLRFLSYTPGESRHKLMASPLDDDDEIDDDDEDEDGIAEDIGELSANEEQNSDAGSETERDPLPAAIRGFLADCIEEEKLRDSSPSWQQTMASFQLRRRELLAAPCESSRTPLICLETEDSESDSLPSVGSSDAISDDDVTWGSDVVEVDPKSPRSLPSTQTSISEDEGAVGSDGLLTDTSEASSEASGMVNPITGERTEYSEDTFELFIAASLDDADLDPFVAQLREVLLFSADDLLCIKSPFKSDEALRVSRLLLQNMKQDRSFEPILLQSFQAGLLRPLRIVAIRCFANPPPSAGDGSPTVSADMLHCDVLDIAQLSDHFPSKEAIHEWWTTFHKDISEFTSKDFSSTNSGQLAIATGRTRFQSLTLPLLRAMGSPGRPDLPRKPTEMYWEQLGKELIPCLEALFPESDAPEPFELDTDPRQGVETTEAAASRSSPAAQPDSASSSVTGPRRLREPRCCWVAAVPPTRFTDDYFVARRKDFCIKVHYVKDTGPVQFSQGRCLVPSIEIDFSSWNAMYVVLKQQLREAAARIPMPVFPWVSYIDDHDIARPIRHQLDWQRFLLGDEDGKLPRKRGLKLRVTPSFEKQRDSCPCDGCRALLEAGISGATPSVKDSTTKLAVDPRTSPAVYTARCPRSNAVLVDAPFCKNFATPTLKSLGPYLQATAGFSQAAAPGDLLGPPTPAVRAMLSFGAKASANRQHVSLLPAGPSRPGGGGLGVAGGGGGSGVAAASIVIEAMGGAAAGPEGAHWEGLADQLATMGFALKGPGKTVLSMVDDSGLDLQVDASALFTTMKEVLQSHSCEYINDAVMKTWAELSPGKEDDSAAGRKRKRRVNEAGRGGPSSLEAKSAFFQRLRADIADAHKQGKKFDVTVTQSMYGVPVETLVEWDIPGIMRDCCDGEAKLPAIAPGQPFSLHLTVQDYRLPFVRRLIQQGTKEGVDLLVGNTEPIFDVPIHRFLEDSYFLEVVGLVNGVLVPICDPSKQLPRQFRLWVPHLLKDSPLIRLLFLMTLQHFDSWSPANVATWLRGLRMDAAAQVALDHSVHGKDLATFDWKAHLKVTQMTDAMGATLQDYVADLQQEGCFFLPSWSEKMHFSAGSTLSYGVPSQPPPCVLHFKRLLLLASEASHAKSQDHTIVVTKDKPLLGFVSQVKHSDIAANEALFREVVHCRGGTLAEEGDAYVVFLPELRRRFRQRLLLAATHSELEVLLTPDGEGFCDVPFHCIAEDDFYMTLIASLGGSFHGRFDFPSKAKDAA